MTGNNYLLNQPKGIDVAIQRLQELLFRDLNWQQVEMCGRVDKIPNAEPKVGFKPYAYYTNNDYRNVARDDKYNANIFFVVGDRHNTNQGVLFTVELKIIFMIDVVRMYPSHVGRADALAQKEANEVLKKQTAFTVTSIGTGVRECLNDFDNEDLKFTNMHPNHVFCLTGTLNYQLSC